MDSEFFFECNQRQGWHWYQQRPTVVGKNKVADIRDFYKILKLAKF
jgi:hypothetical protein